MERNTRLCLKANPVESFYDAVLSLKIPGVVIVAFADDFVPLIRGSSIELIQLTVELSSQMVPSILVSFNMEKTETLVMYAPPCSHQGYTSEHRRAHDPSQGKHEVPGHLVWRGEDAAAFTSIKYPPRPKSAPMIYLYDQRTSKRAGNETTLQ